MEGYINIDKYETFNPDLVHDLEIFPYPFEDETINEIQMIHILEHLGQNPDVFINIMKELYSTAHVIMHILPFLSRRVEDSNHSFILDGIVPLEGMHES